MTADREAKSSPAPKPSTARQGLSAEERRRRLGGWAKWFEPRAPFPVNEELVQKCLQQLRELEAAPLPKKRPGRRAALREKLPSLEDNSGSALGSGSGARASTARGTGVRDRRCAAMSHHDDEPTPGPKVPGTTSCSSLEGRPTARARHTLALVADNSARATTVSGAATYSDSDAQPALGQPVWTRRRHLPSPSVRWVVAAETLPDLHKRLGFFLRRKHTKP